MIGRLKGIVVDKESGGAVIDINGVGYDVSLPLNTLAQLPPLNAEVTLWIHTHVREEVFRLFGFDSKRDRTAFRTLLKISGVGPKVALAVIGALDGSALVEAVQNADTKRLSSIPGIGKKTAERMILELGGKLDFGQDDTSGAAKTSVFTELDSALKNLGFKAAVVQKTITMVRENAGAGTEEELSFSTLLKQCLTILQER